MACLDRMKSIVSVGVMQTTERTYRENQLYDFSVHASSSFNRKRDTTYLANFRRYVVLLDTR